MKFFPSDWQAEQLLGMCSLAARGLWMEMLAIMHRADPYGHLLVNGKKPSDEQLAALARAPVDQVRALTQELEQAGVFSRTRNGTIYSRRMTTDEKRRKDGETAARTGAKVPGSRRHQVAERKQESRPPPGVVDRAASQPPHHPEAKSQNIPLRPLSSKKVTSLDQLDMGELEAWAITAAPNANVRREVEKAKLWTASKGRRHRDATAFMKTWLMKASDDVGPPSEPLDSGDQKFPPGSAIARAIERALTRLEKDRAREIYRLAETSMPDAERMAATYLGEAA
ncbi:hypothetical protein [Inquilinus sp.]|uniref:hypothetical protein n=1 Tax=Inquilinus sp. TaxID=1932117 RepID=UPI0031D3E244